MNEGDVYDMVYDSTRQIYLARATELNTGEGLKSSRSENSQDYVSMLLCPDHAHGRAQFYACNLSQMFSCSIYVCSVRITASSRRLLRVPSPGARDYAHCRACMHYHKLLNLRLSCSLLGMPSIDLGGSMIPREVAVVPASALPECWFRPIFSGGALDPPATCDQPPPPDKHPSAFAPCNQDGDLIFLHYLDL